MTESSASKAVLICTLLCLLARDGAFISNVSGQLDRALMHIFLCPQIKTRDGQIIQVEGYSSPELPRFRHAHGRVALVGYAASYMTKCSGEGICLGVKSGRRCAEVIVVVLKNRKPTSACMLIPWPISRTLLGREGHSP